MDLNAPTALDALDLEILLRLGVAAVLGLVIGLDRELSGADAGLRTHGIICFTAAAMTVSMIALYRAEQGGNLDMLRIFEASGTFVGIIGAGLIVFSKGQVKNLTTAANLWLATVVGIACGAGQWPLVAIAAIISVIMLSVLGVVQHRLIKSDADEKDRE